MLIRTMMRSSLLCFLVRIDYQKFDGQYQLAQLTSKTTALSGLYLAIVTYLKIFMAEA